MTKITETQIDNLAYTVLGDNLMGRLSGEARVEIEKHY